MPEAGNGLKVNEELCCVEEQEEKSEGPLRKVVKNMNISHL